ncbi:MAG: 4Fe-4S dicluster domain-containing protein [Planctomycetota bacterium]
MRLISKSNLAVLINKLIAAGKPVIAPVQVRLENSLSKEGNDSITLYQPIKSFDDIRLDMPFPTKSAKEYFLADSEQIMTYRFGAGNKVEVQDCPESTGLILFGVRPCEAVSYPIMDKVCTWDYNDEFYLARRRNHTVISVSCEACDEFCFCTSVGVNPQSAEGSDILMQKTNQGNYLADFITDKGKKLAEEYKDIFTEAGNEKPVGFKGPAKKFDLALIKPWLEKNFEHPVWDKITLPCIGCGICTFTCPNCHCFDIIDESDLNQGARYKNWDACQFAMFTAHASGHNPRETQAKRFRQRMEHKFNYYPDKFGRTLCVGCGRCIRHCPADMSLLETLVMIDRLARDGSKSS